MRAAANNLASVIDAEGIVQYPAGVAGKKAIEIYHVAATVEKGVLSRRVAGNRGTADHLPPIVDPACEAFGLALSRQLQYALIFLHARRPLDWPSSYFIHSSDSLTDLRPTSGKRFLPS